MNIALLLLRFFRQRLTATLLTTASVALGVALTAGILSLRTASEQAFSQKDTGFEVIVGAKGSPLQLVLNTMYHIGAPVGNIPVAEVERLQKDKRIRFALPMVFGDNVGGFKVVGTTPDFFTAFEYRKNTTIALSEGMPFTKNHQVVLGSKAATTLGVRCGDSVIVRHGLEIEEQGAHEHGKMPVVGILAESGTALDNGVFMTMYTVWDIHYHEYQEQQEAAEAALEQQDKTSQGKNIEHTSHQHEAEHQDEEHEHDIPPDFTTITALVVKLKSPVFYDSFVRSVNEGTSAQAALPIREISGLFAVVGNVNGMLLGVSYLVIIVASMAILAAIYNSLNERRREIAILRSLGAHRRTIFGLIIAEAGCIGFVGCIMGIALARAGLYAWQPALERAVGTRLQTAWLYSFDIWVIGGVCALTILVALVPAWQAYRTDVAHYLAPQS